MHRLARLGPPRPLLLLAALAPALLGAGCQTVKEVSIGYADAIAAASLGAQVQAPYQGLEVGFPALRDLDPTASPSLARLQVTRAEIESVKVTEIALEGASGPCGLPFTALQIQIQAEGLEPATIARAEGGECLRWTLDDQLELAPWFRRPTLSIVAIADGEAFDPAGLSLSLRASFWIDITDKKIE